MPAATRACGEHNPVRGFTKRGDARGDVVGRDARLIGGTDEPTVFVARIAARTPLAKADPHRVNHFRRRILVVCEEDLLASLPSPGRQPLPSEWMSLEALYDGAPRDDRDTRDARCNEWFNDAHQHRDAVDFEKLFVRAAHAT